MYTLWDSRRPPLQLAEQVNTLKRITSDANLYKARGEETLQIGHSMSFSLSPHTLPNTPVEVVTVVGKYEYLLSVKRCRPSPGHTFRATDVQTYYINILESSKSDIHPNLRVKRALVDLEDVGGQVVHAPPPLPLSPERCLLQPYMQACNATSQAVFFVDSDIGRAAENYLAWIDGCSNAVDATARPAAVIVLCGQETDKRKEEVAFELFTHCTSTRERSAVHGRSIRCFSRTEVLYYPRLTGQAFRNCVNWRLFQTMCKAAVSRNDYYSPAAGHHWRERIAYQLLNSSVAFFSRRTDTQPFNIAHALTAGLPSNVPELVHQQAFFRVRGNPGSKGALSSTVAALRGMYMAHYLLVHCPLLELENFRPAAGSSGSLFDSIFDQRFSSLEARLLEHAGQLEDGNTTADAKLHMHKAINQYLEADACITQTHILALGKHSDFFTDQENPQRLCAGCFFAYWDDVLPCRHGFCKACTHNQFPQWKHSARLRIACCPVCLQRFAEPVDIKLQPPTACGRILSLDGGGIKGVIQLEILQRISALVGIHLPLDALFDMAIGTSIGGILAIGLFVNGWNLDTCRTKLVTLAAQVFPPRPPGDGWMRGPVNRVLRYVGYAACVVLQRSLVSGGVIRSVHSQEFGKHGSMLFPDQVQGAKIKVGVTASSARNSVCSLITSYNRPPTQRPRPYKWLQSDNTDMNVQVWEAAQCTSAVPFLFPAAQLQSDRYYDGALAYNNPTAIATAEGRTFWGSGETQNTVLSIGCGTTRDQARHREGPIHSCTRSFFGSMSADKQHNDLVLQGYRFARLDPALDIEAVSLDDVAAIPRLQESFSQVLLHNVAFVEHLQSTAFQLLADMFYIEIDSKTVVKAASIEHSTSAVAMIRPRLPSSCLSHLYQSGPFYPLHFLINGKPLKFSMPKRVSLKVSTLDSPIEIMLRCPIKSGHVSGSPTSIAKLLDAQSSFYRRSGSRKRRPVRAAV